MFELPEYTVLSRQINATLLGKTILKGCLGNSPHKFVWYNRSHEEFSALTRGKTIGTASSRGRWMFVPVEPGYVLVLGECGGKILYHPAGDPLPKKYHLLIHFNDGSAFSVTTQMWGAMELYETGQELDRAYIKGMRLTPVDPGFTPAYFSAFVAELALQEKRSAKGLLTQDQLIPGLGNSIAQDILFRAGLNPRRAIQDMDPAQVARLYEAVVTTVQMITEQGGRYDETDLYGRSGGYARIMDKNAPEKPCPACGGSVVKIQYLGGACYYCPSCQN